MSPGVRLLPVVFAAFAASTAGAHAFLDHADPKVGSTVNAAPSRIRLWFTERLEPAFSTAEIADASGKRVEGASARIDGNDPTSMQITVPALKPGRYTVKWRVLSVDTHVTQGDYSFTLAP
jgi:hypothetical protein